MSQFRRTRRDIQPDRKSRPCRDAWGPQHDVPVVAMPTRAEEAAAPLWADYRRWLVAVAAERAVAAEADAPGWDQLDSYDTNDQERRLRDAGDVADNRRYDLMFHIACAAGWPKVPDAMAREVNGAVARVREGDRLFILAIEKGDDFDEDDKLTSQYRPLVVDLGGLDA